jgi:hypothetical protein
MPSAPSLLDLPGKSRRIRVEPIAPPVPRREPAPAEPERREPAPAEPERREEPAPA